MVAHEIVISGVPPEVTQEEIFNLIVRLGRISQLTVPCFKNGVSKGYYFITFINEKDAENAVLQNGELKLGDVPIIIEYSLKSPTYVDDVDRRNANSQEEKFRRFAYMNPRKRPLPVASGSFKRRRSRSRSKRSGSPVASGSGSSKRRSRSRSPSGSKRSKRS